MRVTRLLTGEACCYPMPSEECQEVLGVPEVVMVEDVHKSLSLKAVSCCGLFHLFGIVRSFHCWM